MRKDILVKQDKIEITFKGTRPKKSVRVRNGWTDWMIDMNDIRDMVIAIDNSMMDKLFKSLTIGYKKISFVAISKREEEAAFSEDKKIVRRNRPGLRRKEYQTVSIFIKNLKNAWPPPPFTITLSELSKIMNALVTLDKPEKHCVKDSLRNYQYLLSMLWMKKTDEKLLKGQRKLSARNIFRLGIP
jgi:hypothetical protein